MSTRTARRVDRTVEKMLRRMGPSAQVSLDSSGSASSAAQALAQMAEIQKRIARGDVDGAKKIASQGIGSAPAETSTAVRGKPHAPKAQKGVLAMIAGTASLLLVGGALCLASFRSGHSVSGTVMLDREPLPQVELAFQLKNSDREPIRVMTSEQGTFSVKSLPPGDYAIFLSSADSAAKLPKRYRTPEATPFRLKLTKDRSDLRMLAVSGKRK